MALKIKEREVSLTENTRIIIATYIDIISYGKGYHVYKMCY